MQVLRADTVVWKLIGPFVAIGDGVTPVTNVTLAAADTCGLLKHNATSLHDITDNDAFFVHLSHGFYRYQFQLDEVDTEGGLQFCYSDASAALAVPADFQVMNQNAFDSLHAAAGTDLLQVDNGGVGQHGVHGS